MWIHNGNQVITKEQTEKMPIRWHPGGRTPNAHTWHLRHNFLSLSQNPLPLPTGHTTRIYFPATIAVPANGTWAEVVYSTFGPGTEKCAVENPPCSLFFHRLDADKCGYLRRHTEDGGGTKRGTRSPIGSNILCFAWTRNEYLLCLCHSRLFLARDEESLRNEDSKRGTLQFTFL